MSAMDECCICMSDIDNKTELDSCNHVFCFVCIKTWSIKNSTCPLCKRNFTILKHSIKSDEAFRVYKVVQELDKESNNSRSVTAPQTLFTRRHIERQAIENSARVLIVNDEIVAYRRSLQAREQIYDRDLWVTGVIDETGSPVGLRDVSPSFISRNQDFCHRLQRWLSREIRAILGYNSHLQLPRITNIVLLNCKRHPIMSHTFFTKIYNLLGSQTRHFIHEFYTFACSTFDMEDYDRYVMYGPQVLSDNESDVELIEVENSDSVIELSDDDDDDEIEILPMTTESIASPPDEIDIINCSANDDSELLNLREDATLNSINIENNVTRKRKYSRTRSRTDQDGSSKISISSNLIPKKHLKPKTFKPRLTENFE